MDVWPAADRRTASPLVDAPWGTSIVRERSSGTPGAGPLAGACLRFFEELLEHALISDASPLFGVLERHEAMFRSQSFVAHKLTLLRIANQLLKRLSKAHDVHLCGRILIFIAKVYPLFDKSGLNPGWLLNSGLALPLDVLQPGSLDTEGGRIDIPLYNTFWGLQSTFQNPGQALEPLAFAKALASITHVLDSFAAIPVTVPAMGYSQSTESRPKKASLPSCSAMEEGESQPAGSTSLNPTRVTAEEEGSSNSTRYLSSSQLFGLQLKDATFRRQFLVQCLVLLHHLQQPSLKEKPPTEPLAGLEELRAKVYASLERTPHKGRRVAAAIATVFADETMWVKWKHAGFPPAQRLKADKPLAAAAAAAPALKAPPLKASPVAAAVKSEAPVASAVEAEAMAAGPVDGPAAVKPQVVVSGGSPSAPLAPPRAPAPDPAPQSLTRPQAKATCAPRYPEVAVPRKRKRPPGPTKAQALVANLSRLLVVSPDSMAGLATTDREKLPDMRTFLQPVIEGLDPESGIESEYRRCTTDSTYAWRAQRLLSRAGLLAFTRLKGDPEALVLHAFPDLRAKFGIPEDPLDAADRAEAKTRTQNQAQKATAAAAAKAPGPGAAAAPGGAPVVPTLLPDPAPPATAAAAGGGSSRAASVPAGGAAEQPGAGGPGDGEGSGFGAAFGSVVSGAGASVGGEERGQTAAAGEDAELAEGEVAGGDDDGGAGQLEEGEAPFAAG
ncbi:MAG: hypothetical protein WDW36_002779 [Sanguina aurantia]